MTAATGKDMDIAVLRMLLWWVQRLLIASIHVSIVEDQYYFMDLILCALQFFF